ncbi:hypothetical protein EXN66_Car003554 [Channa argus]|uniref:Uncharacterized protein n=1 Tax=Channa argus TaxID=215402 RepID=A0A6G1PCB5_CHAAH|nr:hypothetical protein EXN66_Car003554 [Channa argus]
MIMIQCFGQIPCLCELEEQRQNRRECSAHYETSEFSCRSNENSLRETPV